jgi:hypothetical protein
VKLNGFAGEVLCFRRKIMKKTELAEFKKEYENAVRDVDKIINNPYTAILLKYKKAEESDYYIKFRQYALRYWAQLHGVNFPQIGDKDITDDEFNQAVIKRRRILKGMKEMSKII